MALPLIIAGLISFGYVVHGSPAAERETVKKLVQLLVSIIYHYSVVHKKRDRDPGVYFSKSDKYSKMILRYSQSVISSAYFIANKTSVARQSIFAQKVFKSLLSIDKRPCHLTKSFQDILC